MKRRCVMKSNAKCFENESHRRNEKGNPIPAGKNQTLTQIERDMRKQGGGGVLKRAAAPCFGMEGSICVSVLREWGFLSHSVFEIHFQSILHSISLHTFLSCSLHVFEPRWLFGQPNCQRQMAFRHMYISLFTYNILDQQIVYVCDIFIQNISTLKDPK